MLADQLIKFPLNYDSYNGNHLLFVGYQGYREKACRNMTFKLSFELVNIAKGSGDAIS